VGVILGRPRPRGWQRTGGIVATRDGRLQRQGECCVSRRNGLPLTKLEGKARPPRSFEVPLPSNLLRNAFTPLALPHQIRTIAKERLLERVGLMDDSEARLKVEVGILDHLGIEFEEPE
jgi:hypothetical protein